MSVPWQAYVPYHVARDLVQHPQHNPVAHEQRFDAVTLFADISGFTAISEALGQAGRSGTEALTHLVNSYFTELITAINRYGGSIAAFGGDALTALFPYTARTRNTVTCRALQCALDIQQIRTPVTTPTWLD